ncbi:MAG: beta-glucosidase [Cytophagales bacterium]|nr:beta-glucosidase [Rhizobacter sp.]
MTQQKFPAGFVWGVATSAYQIEGAANEDGRGKSIWDTFSHTPGNTFQGHTGDVACDHYHRYAQDIELIAGLGVDAYRFSIAWPRVQPTGKGAWNTKGLDFYDRLVDGLLAKGIAPHATLYHWDLPQALQDEGGWGARDTTDRFADYAEVMGRRLGDRLATLCTHNEPWCTAQLGHRIGQFAPGARDPQLAVQVAHHLLLSHGKALLALRASGVKTPLGIVLNQSSVTPATASAADAALAEREYALFVRWFMDPIFLKRYPTAPGVSFYPVAHENDFEVIAQPLDFLGINYYTRIWASSEEPPRPAPNLHGASDMGWENYPQGLTELLLQVNRDYTLPPVYITENGTASADVLVNGRVNDVPRIEYLRTHLDAIHAAMQEGVDVRGFFYWSLLDNYEWNSGYDKRFGLIHVDYETQARTPKDSAGWYRSFIQRNR